MAVKRRPTADSVKTEVTNEPPPQKKQYEEKKEEPKKESEVKGTKSVKVEADKIVDEEVQIDFMGDSFSKEHASKKTKENTDEYKSTIPPDEKVDKIREDLKKAEADRSSSEKFTFKDILQVATFLVNAFDGGMSILLNFIARDRRVSVYSLPKATKDQLAEQLALILVKYQVKFRIEFLFFMTLVVAYIAPVGGALKHRRKVAEENEAERKQTKEQPKTEDPSVQQQRERNKHEKPLQDAVSPNEENNDPLAYRRRKRYRGGKGGKQSKAVL